MRQLDGGSAFIHEVPIRILRRNDFFSGDEDNAVIEAKDRIDKELIS